MKTIQVYPGCDPDLDEVLLKAANGDTIVVVGTHAFTPQEPTNVADKHLGGSALMLHDVEGVRIIGEPGAVIQLTAHGSGLGLQNCKHCSVSGLTIKGQGYLIGNYQYYFSAIYLGGVNDGLEITDNVIMDHGDQGIGHILDGHTDNSLFARNKFYRGGFLTSPTLGGDGAAIAVGGSRNKFVNNYIEDWLRGIEIETKYASHDTSDNLVEANCFVGVLWHNIMVSPTHGKADLFVGNTIRRNIISTRQPKPPCQNWRMAHPIYITGGRWYSIEENTIAGRAEDWCGIDMSPDFAEISDSLVFGNRILGVGRTGISIAEIQGVLGYGINRIRVIRNEVGPVGGRNIRYQGSNHCIGGNTLVRGPYEPIYSDDDKGLTCCGSSNLVIG